jgi:predicted 2-oxoglutarate/Fe(II)-dependent dioxygenase YbiX
MFRHCGTTTTRKRKMGKLSKQRQAKLVNVTGVPTSLFYDEPSFASVHVIHPQIMVIENFYSKQFIKQLRSALTSLELETTPPPKSKLYAARVNDRVCLEDTVAAKNWWKHLHSIVGDMPQFASAKGLNSNIRIYRYTEGQFFGAHIDESVWTDGGRTQWTVLLYLTGESEGLRGGETVFYDEGQVISVVPRAGTVCLHRHGGDCLEHEAMEVVGGEKWVVRSDIVF